MQESDSATPPTAPFVQTPPPGALGQIRRAAKKPFQSRESILALRDAEVRSILKAAEEAQADPEYTFAPVPIYDLARWLLRTATHISVISEPEDYKPRLEPRSDGLMTATWFRPKKRGLAAQTSVVLRPDDELWMRPFLAWVYSADRRTKRTLQRALAGLGTRAKLERVVTADSFRHTAISAVARLTHDPWQTARFGNVSLRTAGFYIAGSEFDADRTFVTFVDPWAVKPEPTSPTQSSRVCPACLRPFVATAAPI